MSSNDVYAAVQAHLTANWSACPVVYENAGKPPDNAAWVYVEAEGDFDGYDLASIGAGSDAANLKRETGTIFLHVHVPSGTGSLDARAKAKQLADLFRGLELLAGTLTFRAASIGAGGGSPDGKFYRITSTVDYVFDT